MLLQRLYNWIKYKSLPTSFLFRNRLFIERNTKHRRIYSIFGALMRNSKWGNFELSNIKYQFRFNYTRYLLWTFSLTILALLAWFFKKYYVYTHAFNGVALFVWLSVDAFDYYLSFSLWCVTAIIALSTNWIYSYFLEQTNLRYPSLKEVFFDNFFEEFTKPEEIDERRLLLSVSDLKYVFYHWISDDKNPHSSAFLEKLFDTEVSSKWWGNHYDFFIKLFKASYLCNLNSESFSIKHLHYSLNFLYPTYLSSPLKKLASHQSRLSFFDSHTTILFWYTLNSYANYGLFKTRLNPSLRLFDTRHQWNLSSFDIEAGKLNPLFSNVSGSFYLPSLTFNKLSPLSINFQELWSFPAFAKNQINASKWNRWLYKYSLLHRRFLRNSHKITLTKKLFASGFYDNKFLNRNTWNAAHAKKMSKTLLHNLGSIYYKNLFQHSDSLKWQAPSPNAVHPFLSKKSISLFSFYENSYLWVAKRFYCFNTIPSNLINSSLSLKTTYSKPFHDLHKGPATWNSVLTSYLGNLYFLNLYVPDFSSLDQPLLPFLPPVAGKFLEPTHYHSKDLYLLFDDNDLLTPEFLDVTYWVTSNSTNLKGSPNALNYCEFHLDSIVSTASPSFKVQNTNKSLNSEPTSIVFCENHYLFDIILISYIY